MKKLFLIMICIVSLSFAQEAAKRTFPNPFMSNAGAFYFVHDGGPLKLSISFKTEKVNNNYGSLPGKTKERGAYVASIYDQDEKRVEWRYDYVTPEGDNTLVHDFGANAPAGIYQIRYSGANLLASVDSLPSKQFGYMPLRNALNGTSKEQFADTYIYIPDNAEKMNIYTYNQKPLITDENGVVLSSMKNIDLVPHRGKVWNVKTNNLTGHFSELAFDDVPIIMCPDADTAKAIHGSLEKSDDGLFFAHKYQVKMHEWMKKASADDLSIKTVPMMQFVDEIEKDPAALGLIGGYGVLNYINSIIETQNIDPRSKEFTEWHLDNRQFRYSHALAIMFSLNKPYNPYYMNPTLEKRILLAEFKTFLNWRENDTSDENHSNYSGGDGLYFVTFISAFERSYKLLKDREAASLYEDAIRRYADRWSMFRVSCDNQSSHWPFVHYNIYSATGIDGYRRLAQDYIWGMSREGGDRFMKTGYQQESYGPDGTYQGLGTCYQAIYYRWSKDPVAKRTLQIIYDLYNHSVAPELDGRVYGCSNYGHRTAGSWVNRQYNGGLQLMKGELPEAAVWFRNEKKRDIRQDFLYTKERPAGYHGGSIYCTSVIAPYFSEHLFPSETLPGARFPVEISNDFTKNFNNEFHAIRRPAYYAFAYTGKTSAEWCGKARTKKTTGRDRDNKWWVTQGLGLLWFEEFGNVITAMNWNAGTGYFVRVDFNKEECAYPDYFGFRFALPDKNSLDTTTTYFAMPGMSVTRNYDFTENGMKVDLSIKFEQDAQAADIYEQIPLLNHNKRKFTFKNGAQWQEEPCTTDEVRINGIISIKLAQKLPCDFGGDSTLYGQTIHPLRIHFGKTFKAGDTVTLQYSITK